MSGQHIKEFRDFLSKYPDEFVVTESSVYLKKYEGSKHEFDCLFDEMDLCGKF